MIKYAGVGGKVHIPKCCFILTMYLSFQVSPTSPSKHLSKLKVFNIVYGILCLGLHYLTNSFQVRLYESFSCAKFSSKLTTLQ